MDEKLRNSLIVHCSYVRSVIESCVKDYHSDGLFKSFPHAYCDLASIWLHDYLYFKDYKNIQFRSKMPFTKDIEGNHVWLHLSGYNLDITCDQFNNQTNNFSSVIVATDCELNYLYFAPDEIAKRNDKVLLEYSPLKLAFYPEIQKEQDVIYNKLNIKFHLSLP